MKQIDIKQLMDYRDCETCGPSSAEGYSVSIDGEEVIDMIPIAHCYDGTSYTLEELIIELLHKLGHNATFTGG